MISKQDVIKVADSLNISLIDSEIDEVIERYPYEQEIDPTGEWYLVVEHIIYSIKD